MRLAADDLTGFVPFAGDYQKVAWAGIGDCGCDRFAAVADLYSVRGGGKDRAPDLCWRLVSRVVVCHVNPVRQAGRCPSHQRALAGIAVAAAAKQGDKPPRRMRTQCREDSSERIRRVGIIDDDSPAPLALGDELQPTGDAGQMSESLGGDRLRAASRDNKTERRQRVHRLESTREGQYQPAAMPKNIDEQNLTVAFWLAREKAEIRRGVSAVGENRMARFAAHGGKTSEFTAVSVEDSRPARDKKRSEQPLFRGAVVGHVAVIVEVISGQVGKSGRGYSETVESPLVETVARGFDRYLLDAFRGKRSEITVERDRVRCRQGARALLGRGHHPEGAEARRGTADRRPDLADEMNDRRLTIGAGDGDDGARLSNIKARRQKRQPAMRARVDQDREALAAFGRESESVGIIGQDRDRATGHRVDCEMPPIQSRTRQGGKEKAWANRPRVGADTQNLGIGDW